MSQVKFLSVYDTNKKRVIKLRYCMSHFQYLLHNIYIYMATVSSEIHIRNNNNYFTS